MENNSVDCFSKTVCVWVGSATRCVTRHGCDHNRIHAFDVLVFSCTRRCDIERRLFNVKAADLGDRTRDRALHVRHSPLFYSLSLLIGSRLSTVHRLGSHLKREVSPTSRVRCRGVCVHGAQGTRQTRPSLGVNPIHLRMGRR